MAVYSTYQLESSQVEWNEELEGILPKGWVETELGRALFKQASTSESKLLKSRSDWSEKVVWELTKLIKLPAARYELATLVDGDKELPGTISLDCSMAGDEKRYPLEELLRGRLANYDFPEDYTISNTLSVLANTHIQLPPNYEVPEGIKDGADLFVGIVMLDAWIGNSDRHDRNLEIVKQVDGKVYLSPVFDNGHSLGATEKPELRASIAIADYSQNYNEACFVEGEKELTVGEAFEVAASIRPEAAQVWLKELGKVKEEEIARIFEGIPKERISAEARLFAQNLLDYNRWQLFSLSEEKKETSRETETLDSLYQRYAQGVNDLGLARSQQIAIKALKDGVERERVVEMMKIHDSAYKSLERKGGEKTAERTVISRAEVEIFQSRIDESVQKSQNLKESKSRGRSR